MKAPTRPRRSAQRGAVLITTVILLVLLTILALAAVSMNSTQTRMAANAADNEVAQQSAEGTLAQVESQLILSQPAEAAFALNSNGLYMLAQTAPPCWANAANPADVGSAPIWSNANATLASTFQGGSKSAAQYVIEKLPSVLKPGQSANATAATVAVYRITVRAVGASGRAPVVLQSTVQLQ